MPLFLLDGPSASGKSTLLRALLERFPQLTFCRRVTTRAPRPGDLDDYDFISVDEFARRRQAGELALFREFEFGMSYGLPRQPIEAALQAGRPVLALVDLGTAPQGREIWPDCAQAILLCSPLADLAARLSARGCHTPEQIQERLGNARQVLQQVPDYDYVVVNRTWSRTFAQLEFIVDQHL